VSFRARRVRSPTLLLVLRRPHSALLSSMADHITAPASFYKPTERHRDAAQPSPAQRRPPPRPQPDENGGLPRSPHSTPGTPQRPAPGSTSSSLLDAPRAHPSTSPRPASPESHLAPAARHALAASQPADTTNSTAPSPSGPNKRELSSELSELSDSDDSDDNECQDEPSSGAAPVRSGTKGGPVPTVWKKEVDEAFMRGASSSSLPSARPLCPARP